MEVGHEKVQELQAWLAAIIESTDDGIISKTLDGIITSWNPGAERIFGYSAAEIIGQPMTRLFPPNLIAEESRLLARLARGERVEHFETVRVAKDGRELQVSVTISPVRNAAGKIVGVSKIVRDITVLKQREQEREQIIVELQRALGEVRTLSGLLPICSWCHKVRDDKGYWEEVTAYLERKDGVQLSHGICPDCVRKQGFDPL